MTEQNTAILRDKVELAYFLLNVNTDVRTWGILEDFSYTRPYKYYFWDMQDKYVRGKGIFDCMNDEYQLAKDKCMYAFIKHIEEKGIEFPVKYEQECTYADGRFTCFDVNYTTIPEQLTLAPDTEMPVIYY